MKQKILTLLLALIAGAGMTFAETYGGACGTSLTWTLTTDDGVLVISGNGEMLNYSSSSSPWYAYRTSITAVNIPNSMTNIGDYAFSGCSSLTSITIPNSVTSIGNYAFYGSSGLTSVEIPNSVTSIGYGAFSYCSSLTAVTIPNGVTSIDIKTFNNCNGLISVTIPNSVTNIERSVFENCSSLTSVTIPNSVTYIGDYAFSGCSGLTSITCEAITPPSLGVSYYGDAYHCAVFDNVDRTISLYVPTQSLYDYTNAFVWKNFKNIQPIPYSTPEIYNINFVNYDGSELQSGEVESGTMPEYNGATPTRPADAQYTYAFSGWTPEIVAVTGDATYTAMFEETLNTYTITWQDESGNVIRTDEVGYGLTPEFTGPTPTKEGYDFVGWLPNIKPATENTKYTTYFIPQAHAEEKVYTVNINGENCSLNINNQYPEGTVITIEAVADECFEFQQWSDGETANPRTVTVTKDMNLTAEFNKLRYTVTGQTEAGTGGKVQIIKK